MIQTFLGGFLESGRLPPPEPAVFLALALDGLSLYLGVQIRSGRSWVLALNTAAIIAFLYLSAIPDPVALVFGLAHLYVVGALILRRPWFDAMRAWRTGKPISREYADPEEDAPSRGL